MGVKGVDIKMALEMDGEDIGEISFKLPKKSFKHRFKGSKMELLGAVASGHLKTRFTELDFGDGTVAQSWGSTPSEELFRDDIDTDEIDITEMEREVEETCSDCDHKDECSDYQDYIKVKKIVEVVKQAKSRYRD